MSLNRLFRLGPGRGEMPLGVEPAPNLERRSSGCPVRFGPTAAEVEDFGRGHAVRDGQEMGLARIDIGMDQGGDMTIAAVFAQQGRSMP